MGTANGKMQMGPGCVWLALGLVLMLGCKSPGTGIVASWVLCKDPSCTELGRGGILLEEDGTYSVSDTWNSTLPDATVCSYCSGSTQGTYTWDGKVLTGSRKGSVGTPPSFQFDFIVEGDLATFLVPVQITADPFWTEYKSWPSSATQAPSVPNTPWHAMRDPLPVGGCCND